MTYELLYSKKFSRQLKKLNKLMQKRIVSALERCRIRPHAHVKKLVNSPFFSLRVGDYRLILDIHQGKLRILVLQIGHRKNIYKNP